MKKQTILIALLACALLSQTKPPTYALEAADASLTIEERRLLHTDAEVTHSESLLPARPEPEELIQLRLERRERKREKAQKEADARADALMRERHEAWEANFPIVEGSGKEADFLNKIAKDSVSIAREADLYPSVLLAQAGLESHWGKSGLTVKHHNLFGIKGQFNGQSAKLKTWEDIGGKEITIKAGFRSYPSLEVSIMDYAQLLRYGLRWNEEFYKGTWRSQTDSYKDVTAFLQGRYATDTQYTSKLNALIERFDLTRFDDVEAEETDLIVVEPVIEEDPPLPDNHYLVKEGDTVQLLLMKFDMTLDDFISLNNLTEARLHVNQVVMVNNDKNIITTSSKDSSVLSKDHLLSIKERVKGGSVK